MSNLQKKLESKKVLKGLILFVVIFFVLNILIGWVFYNGFFFGVSSSATYLTNYDNLDRTLTWDNFKANHTQIDPKLVQPPNIYFTSTRCLGESEWRVNNKTA